MYESILNPASEALPVLIPAGAALVAFIMGFLVCRLNGLRTENQLNAKLDLVETELQRSSIEAENLRNENDQLSRVKSQYELLRVRQQTELQSLRHRISDLQQQLNDARDALVSQQRSYQVISQAHVQLKTSLAEKQKHFVQQMQQLEQSKSIMKAEFEHLATEILERKGETFKALNHESISSLLKPVQAEMQGFRQKVESIHTEDLKQRSALKNELENLQKLNQEITNQAERLTTALQGQKKVQGNWGELMLENVLDNSGLRLGKDYCREVSFNTHDGRLRPDAIVYLPQGKHLVIDAKTSLSAYTRFVNTEQDLDRQQALAEHSQAVGARITELADKSYYSLPGLNSPEVVIMFIPVESAYVEALKYDETLYQRAIERNVLVATPTTLLTSLNIVRQLWRFEDQSKHSAELARRAGKFYNKLNGFLGTLMNVGKQLDKAKGDYDRALGQLSDGRGNLIKQASEFRDLGVSVQKELPAELVERAELELSFSSVEKEV